MRHILSIYMNNKYKIKMEAPLIRTGFSIETEVSERYVVPVLDKMMELVRTFNENKSITNPTGLSKEDVGSV